MYPRCSYCTKALLNQVNRDVNHQLISQSDVSEIQEQGHRALRVQSGLVSIATTEKGRFVAVFVDLRGLRCFLTRK